MNYGEAKKTLAANGQEQILRFWSSLGTAARKALLAQIATIDFKELARCRAMLPGTPHPSSLTPQPSAVPQLSTLIPQPSKITLQRYGFFRV